MSVRGRFLLGLLLTLVSGVAALSHQLLWTQRMTDLLGSSVESTTPCKDSQWRSIDYSR